TSARTPSGFSFFAAGRLVNTLTATSRSSRRSPACHTPAIRPVPTTPSSRYLVSRTTPVTGVGYGGCGADRSLQSDHGDATGRGLSDRGAPGRPPWLS